MNRKLRMGMVGGGRGAFIGAVHRMAANLDGKIELVAGAFSADPEKSRLSGEDFFLDPDPPTCSGPPAQRSGDPGLALTARRPIGTTSWRRELLIPAACLFVRRREPRERAWNV